MCIKEKKTPNNKTMTKFMTIICFFPTGKLVGLVGYQEIFGIHKGFLFLNKYIFQSICFSQNHMLFIAFFQKASHILVWYLISLV